MTGPRILGMAEGGRPDALSGIPHFLLAALDRRFPVQRLDYAPHGARRLALAAATIRPSRAAWRARFHTSRLAHHLLTRTLADRLGRHDHDFDLALQVLGWVGGQPRPYALYVDQTRLMAERGWPAWMPLSRRERAEILALERAMYGEAFHVFVMGAQALDSLVSDYGVDPSRVTIVGGGVNFDSLPEAVGPSADPLILFVGRDFERKGGHCLIQAFGGVRRELPDATLHIVGVPEQFGAPGVVSHGSVPSRQQLGDLYRRARVFCLPSRYEPWGLVLVEAMAHGLPCIGTTTGSMPDILDNGRAGLLVAPDDPGELADAVIRLLSEDHLARTVGSSGRRRVEERFTWERVADRMAPILSRVEAAEA
jgi:glycosyltransferase involved in cell wall biosynthesis